MIRKLLLPAVAMAALAGCVTDYGYRGGAGDYYYGRAPVEYGRYGGYAPNGGYYGYDSRYGGYYGGYIGRGGYYGYGPYGYGGYGYSPYGYNPYGYRYGYGYPYPGYPPVYYPRPPRDQGNDGSQPAPPSDNHSRVGEDLPPWRRIGRRPPPEMGQGGVEALRSPEQFQRHVRVPDQSGPRPMTAPRPTAPVQRANGETRRAVAPAVLPSRPAASPPLRSERRSSEEP